MTKAFLLTLLLTLQVAAVPQTAVPQVATGLVEGIVVKGRTAAPVFKARVTLQGPGEPLESLTAADGKFSFRNLRPGRYNLTAAKNGFVETEYGQRGPNSEGIPLVLAVSQDGPTRLTGVELRLIPTGAITGRIVDPSGEPVSRAQVQAARLQYRDGMPSLAHFQTVIANDLGEYRLFWLPPGRYYVSATVTDAKAGVLPIAVNSRVLPAAFGSVSSPLAAESPSEPRIMTHTAGQGTVNEIMVPTFHPSATRLDQARAVEVRAETATDGVDITVAPLPVYSVRGRLVNADGQTVIDPIVSIAPRSESPGAVLAILNDQPRGGSPTRGTTFELRGVPSGSYLIQGSTPGSGDTPMTGIVSIDVGNRDIDNLSIVIQPAVMITGRVTIEGTPVQPSGDVRAIQVVLRPEPLTALLPEISSTIVRDGPGADGSIRIPVPYPKGNFRVSLRNLGELGYVKSIRFGADDGLQSTIRLNGVSQATLDIVISANAASLSGRVLNEKHEPAAAATVALVPEARFRQRQDLFVTATTDDSGQFRVRGIAPGAYRVFAWEDVEPGAWFDAEFMRTQEALGRPMSFGEGNSESVELSMIPYR